MVKNKPFECGLCGEIDWDVPRAFQPFKLTCGKTKLLCDNCIADSMKKRRARNQRKRYRQNIAKRV